MEAELELSGKVQIDGKKSIDDTTKSLEGLLVKVSRIVDASKKASDALRKIYSSVPTQKLSRKEQSEVDDFARRYKNESRQAKNEAKFYSAYRQRQNQSYGFTPITSQVSRQRFQPMYDEISARYQRNQTNTLSLVQNKALDSYRKRFTFTQNNAAPYGEGQELAEKIKKARKERAAVEERLAEQARKQFNHNLEQSKFLLTADAGLKKIKEGNLVTEEAIAQSKKSQKQIEKELEEKIRKMTEFQSEKIRLGEEELKIKRERAETEKRSEDRKEREENSAYNQFRNKHPELFANRGGGNYDKRKQASKFVASLGETASSLGSGGKAVGYVLDSVSAFIKGVPVGLATTFSNLAKGITEFGQAAVKAYAEIESIKTQLGVVFSSQTQAESAFGEISQYAVKSPFGIQQTTELAVLLKQSGVYASDLMDTLKMLGDTAGGNMEKMKRIANNYAQIMAIGKASMLDMRQFAYAGIPIFEAVSKELGVSQQELRKLISDGKVTADIVEKVFKDLTGVNGIFENATEKGAKTLKARLQNLADAKQLAMSSWGESIVNTGNTYGNDGIINTFVTAAENFFNWMKEHADVKNIDKNVTIIANSNKRIEALEKLLDYAKSTGDKNAQKIIEAALKAQQSLVDIEKQRAILVESYDSKNTAYNSYKEQYGDLSLDEIRKRRYSEYEFQLRTAQGKLALDDDSETNKLSEEERLILIEKIAVYKELIADMKNYEEAIKKAKETTEEEIAADRERNLLTAQNLAYDTANKNADSSTSLMSSFQELNEAYKASDEYKDKQEKEHEKTLKEALSVLKEISKHTDKQGNVDITAYSAEEFNNLIQKGALKATNKKQVTPSDKSYTPGERERLVNEYGHFQEELRNIVKENSRFLPTELVNRVEKNNINNLRDFDDKKFYKEFSKTWKEDKELVEELKKNNALISNKVNEVSKALTSSTVGYQIVENGDKITESLIDNVSKTAFIPLWKRIFSSNTGLTAQSMTDKNSTLGNYMNDVANRNIVAGVMKATMQSMGINTAMRLLKPSDDAKSIQMRGTSQYINQVDWKKSKDALKDFATQLSASTDVISAYRQGLESELDTLQNLVMHGFTDMESADIQKQKYLSVKTLSKYSSEADSQLVNALGDKLKSATGNDIVIQEGKFFEKVGNDLKEVALEQLNIDDSIVDILRDWFPKIQKEIAETKLKERNNQEFESRLNDIMAGKLTSLIYDASTMRRGKISNYMLSHQWYVQDQYINALDSVKKEEQFSEFSEVSNADITTAALNALARKEKGQNLTTHENQILDLFDAILDKVKKSADELGIGEEGSSFQNLINIANKAEYEAAVLSAFNKLQNGEIEESYSLEKENGIRGGNAKFLKNILGLDRAFDLQSLYEQANESGGHIEVSESFRKYLAKKYGYGVDSESNDVRWDEGFLENGDDKMQSVVEATIRWKQAMEDTKEVAKELGENISKMSIDLAKSGFTSVFEQLGENLVLGKEATEGMDKVFKNLTIEMLKASGEAMIQAGWQLVARGAADKNYAMIAGGLALAATGGVASGLGNAITKLEENTEDEDKLAKLQSLQSSLADLLKQAREDAIYYENTVRHKKAITANENLTKSKSVHDAIITPSGGVITTDPKDYLIATKTPKSLVGGGAPTINFSVVDKSTGIKVTQQRSNYNPDTNTIEFEAIIESKIQEVIATSKGDEAFSAREARLQGRNVIA